jgi:PncC family amidohydrolase
MAAGVCARFGADYGIGVTGIAGPGGGSAEKPVGLVFIAVATRGEGHEVRVIRRVFSGSRKAIKDQAAEAALELLTESI